jgi:hypothetical protein
MSSEVSTDQYAPVSRRLQGGALGVGDSRHQLLWRIRVDGGAACAYRLRVPTGACWVQADKPDVPPARVLRSQ